MLIPGFARLLAQEQPPIQAALERAVARLPAPVREVAGYALLTGGKRLRPLLTLTAARLFGCERADLYDLAAAPEMIHVASLLHDDVLDAADTRRGRRAAHQVFGVIPCLLAGDALLAEASHRVARFGDPELVLCVSDAMLRTVAGEAHEIARQGSLSHGLDEYLSIIEGKTGWLLRASCRLGALFAGAGPRDVDALSSYGLNLGMAFQIVDDALDFADEAETGKPTGGDLREGKLTPPLLFHMNALPDAERSRFAEAFAHGRFSPAEVADISRRIRDRGFDRAARDMADASLDKAAACLEGLPDRPERDILRQALSFVRDRRA
ncbi:MAG: polyprenyl synthetase family protein [Desulfovibrionaceae bacterium]|nr:polyprenyl synthetase family protein [Desulfovibrionaceae bacterium]